MVCFPNNENKFYAEGVEKVCHNDTKGLNNRNENIWNVKDSKNVKEKSLVLIKLSNKVKSWIFIVTLFITKENYSESYLTPAIFLLPFSNQHEIVKHEDHACYSPQNNKSIEVICLLNNLLTTINSLI